MTGALWFNKGNKSSELFIDNQTNYCTYLSYRNPPAISQIIIQENDLIFSKTSDGINWFPYSIYHKGNKPSFSDVAYLGTNLTTSDTDTVDFWAELGTGYCVISAVDTLKDQPYQWGWLWSYVYNNAWVIQEFHAANTPNQGCIWRRYGLKGRNDNLWEGSSTWKIILDTTNFSSYALPLSGGTMTGKLIINNTNDIIVGTTNTGALLIGPPTGAHIALDQNEIMAKNSGTTAGTLFLNNEGGLVQIGGGGLKVNGKITTNNWETSATNYIRHATAKGTAPSATSWKKIIWRDNSGTANSDNLGIVGNAYFADGHVETFLRVYTPLNGTDNNASIYLAAYTNNTFKAGMVNAAFYGAVWNDYAEFRKAETIEPGRVVIEHSSGEMKLSTERLQPGAEIISDTFGFAIGETDEYKTPIAATGRVLAYPAEDRYSYPLGCAVCSGPNGTVSQMTREEIKEYPERIIGTVSEIPEYKNWGTGNVEVNGRIWIRIR